MRTMLKVASIAIAAGALPAAALKIDLPAETAGPAPVAVASYLVIAWLCWVPNLLLACWFTRLRPVRQVS